MTVVRFENFLSKHYHEHLRWLCDKAVFDATNDVDRSGLRPNAEACLEWDGFDLFGLQALTTLWRFGDEMWPEAMTQRSWRHIELTRMYEGSYFAQHNDAPAHDPYAPVFTFLYYIGDDDSFDGGEHFHRNEDGRIDLYPATDNCLMMYRGTDIHGVLPLIGECATRYTINGYFAP